MSGLGCISRSNISNQTLIHTTLNYDKFNLDQDTFQNHELETQEMKNRLVNWSMPENKLIEIYKINMFDIFKSKKLFILHNLLYIYICNKHETIN